MKIRLGINIFFAFMITAFPLKGFYGQQNSDDFWRIENEKAVIWDVYSETRLPHEDDIEMAGQRAACIVRYHVDENKRLRVNRDLIFPQLRRFLRTSEPDWHIYRAYLRNSYGDEYLPVILAGEMFIDPPLDSVKIDGKITFYHKPENDIMIKRTLYPSMTERQFVEKFTLINTGSSKQILHIGPKRYRHMEPGMHGIYTISIQCDSESEITLGPDESYSFAVYFSARNTEEPPVREDFEHTEGRRDAFLEEMRKNLVLRTPDPVINTLFYFSKIRAAENIFDTKMGLVHSPGGGNYYAGIWANDQIEYSGPFFPYLGYEDGNRAAFNAYLHFMNNIPEEGDFIKSSFEMEGDLPCCSKDRGDAAMISYGTSQFVLALGDKKIAEELWPLIEWSLDYNHKNLNEHGVVMSDTDEMEGRVSTGTANLSASSLYYGGLINAARAAAMIGKEESIIEDYSARAEALAQAIEEYFGANIDGLETYRYYEGHETFRHWICLPLVMGIDTRREDTIKALFDRLWTDDGILVDPDENVLWDRGTLYAFRGAFKAGAKEALERLLPFSRTRLLGKRVPYMVEAYPEYGMRHLSAESALYCRVFTEGILGIEPAGLREFIITPQVPEEWDYFSIRNMHVLKTTLSFEIQRIHENFKLKIFENDIQILEKEFAPGQKMKIQL